MNVSANSRDLVESDDDLLDAELRKSISSTIYATLCQVDIYTISTQYLHTIYTVSTNYLHTISTHRDWCVLRDVAGVNIVRILCRQCVDKTVSV